MIFVSKRFGRSIMYGSISRLLCDYVQISGAITEMIAKQGFDWMYAKDVVSDIARAAAYPDEALTERIISLVKQMEEARKNEHSGKS